MQRMFKGNALDNQEVSTIPKGRNLSRRDFLKIGAVGGGGAVAVLLAPHAVRYITSLRSQYPQELPEIEIRALMVRREFYLRQNGGVLTHAPVTTYYQIGGSVFELQPVKSELDEKRRVPTPLSLIYKANATYNSGTRIKGDLANRALNLFNILQTAKLSELEEGKIQSFKLKIPPTPIIHTGVTYEVPVPAPYKSLEEAVASARR